MPDFYREPLYIVIYRKDCAEKDLKAWASKNKKVPASVKGNKLELYSASDLGLFRFSWAGCWHSTTIWDCWNKRHLEFI